MMYTRWDEVVTSAFWRRDREDRSLYFEKSMIREPVTSIFIHLSTESDLIEYRLTTHIEIAILESDLLARSCMFVDLEWGNF